MTKYIILLTNEYTTSDSTWLGFDEDGANQVISWLKDTYEALDDLNDLSNGMDDHFMLFAQRAEGYDKLTDAQKNFVTEYIKATGDIVDAEGNMLSDDEILKKAKSYEDFVNDFVNNDLPNMSDKTKEKVNQLFSLDKDSMSAVDYEKQVRTLLDELQKELNLDDDTVHKIQVSLGFDFTADGSTQVDTLIKQVQGKLQDEFDDKVAHLKIDDLIVAAKVVAEIPEGQEIVWDDLIKGIREYRSELEQVASIDAINKNLDDIQSAYSTLASARDEYNQHGAYSLDTVQALLSLEPQYLAMLVNENGQIAINEQAMLGLVNAQIAEAKSKIYASAIAELNALAEQKLGEATETSAGQKSNAVVDINAETEALGINTEAAMKNAAAHALKQKGVTQEDVDAITGKYNNMIKALDGLVNGMSLNFGGAMSGFNNTGKSAKDAGKAAKDAADKIEDINRQLDDLSKSEALEAVKNKFDNMELAITRTTDALGLLDTTLESQAEDDYIGKLETVTRQLGLAQQKSTLLRNEFAQLSATEATTGDIANELANRMKSTADGIAETQKSIMEYGHNMTEYYMSAMKSVGAMSKSTLDRASSLFERNVKTLTEGSLSGFSFTLADSVPQSAYDIQRAENLSIEEEMRRYYDSVANMQKVALDLQYQELLEDNARKRHELLESLSEAQGTLQESANNAVGIQKTTNAITSAAQKADDANKVGEAQAWSGQMQGVMSDLSGWMTENPVKAPGLDTSSWEKMVSDAQDYANKVNGIYGNMSLGGGIGGIFATGTGTTSTAKGKGSGMGLAETAMKYLGTPYVWGGSTPKTGFDCSGLVHYVAQENGIFLPRTAAMQFKHDVAVDKNNLQPGDLVFFIGEGGTKTSPGHVGIYIGNDQYIHSPQTGDNVKISKLSSRKDYVGATRIAKYAKGTRDFEAYGKKPNGIAGENRRREILINKTTGEQTVIDTPTLIDTNDYDVVGEKDTAKLLGNRYANGTFGNWTNLALAGGLPHLTVAQIQAILSNTSFQNSPLNKPGAAEGIYNAQQKTGISALATLGMAAFEGGWAKSKVSYAKNNYWGWNHYPANGMTAFEHATTFSSDVGEAFTDYSTRLAKGYASSTINSMANTYSGGGAGWATETGKILNQFGNLLKNSGLTDFAPFSGDLTAAVSNIGDTTSAMAQNVQIIAKKDFGTELREFLAGNTASESDVEDVEKDLLEYIKENVQVSEESNKRFVENWNKLQTYQKQQKQYFDSLDRALKGYMGTDQYDALRYKATTAAEDYLSEILNMSANMMLEQYKSSFDMANDAAKQILAYYNKQMADGADATTLTTIADAYNEAQEIAEEFSDKYVEQMNAQTEFMVSNDNRLLQEVTNSLSWLEDGNEQLEIQQERVSDISERYRIINERIKNYNSQLDELNRKQAVATETIQGMYNDERYSPLLQRYDTSKWLDAEGELTAQFTADLALMNATMAELVPLANQFAQRLSENTKAIHEADDARNSIIDSRNELNKDNIDSQIDKYVEFRERVAEVLEFEKSVNDALVSAQQTYNGFIDSLREEQNTIDAELAANKHLGGWLSDDTRKQLFNEDDWAEETAEIARLRDEAQSLTDKYKSDISGLTEQEQWKQEGITAEYNKQMEALKGQLSIAKQKLQTAKDQASIENALKEKDTQLIMGNRIQNVADPDKLYELEKTAQESRLKLLDEETKASEAEDVRNMERISDTLGTQIENINYIVSAINDLPDEEREAFSVLIPSIEELTAAIQSIRKDNQWNIINDDMTESAYTRLPFEKILGYGQLDHEEFAEQVLAGINSGLIEDNEYNRRIIYENLANHDNKTLTDPNNAGYDVYGAGEYVGTGKQLLKTHVGSIVAEMLERGRLDKAAQELLSADYLDEYGRHRRPTTVTGDGSVKYGMYPHTVVSGNGAVKYALPDNMVLDDDKNARHLTRPDTVISGDGDMTYIMPTVTVTETDEAANKKPHSIELSNGTDFTGDGSFVIDGKVYTPVDWNAMLPPIDLMQLARPEYPVYNGDMSGFFKQTYGVTDNSRNFHIEHLEVINPLSADDVINGLLNKTDGLAKITNNQ